MQQTIGRSLSRIAAESPLQFAQVSFDRVGQEVDEDVWFWSTFEQERIGFDKLRGFVLLDTKPPQALHLREDGQVTPGLFI